MTPESRPAKTKICGNPARGMEFQVPGKGTWKYCSPTCWDEASPTKVRIPRSPAVDPEEVADAEDGAETAILALEAFVRKMTGPDSTIDDARELQVLSERVVGAVVVRERLKGRPWAAFSGPMRLSHHTLRLRYDLPEGTRRRA